MSTPVTAQVRQPHAPAPRSAVRALAIALAGGELLRVAGRAWRLEVRVLAGGAWLTRAGDARDHLLEAGARFDAIGGGLLVLQALDPALETRVELRLAPRWPLLSWLSPPRLALVRRLSTR